MLDFLQMGEGTLAVFVAEMRKHFKEYFRAKNLAPRGADPWDTGILGHWLKYTALRDLGAVLFGVSNRSMDDLVNTPAELGLVLLELKMEKTPIRTINEIRMENPPIPPVSWKEEPEMLQRDPDYDSGFLSGIPDSQIQSKEDAVKVVESYLKKAMAFEKEAKEILAKAEQVEEYDCRKELCAGCGISYFEIAGKEEMHPYVSRVGDPFCLCSTCRSNLLAKEKENP